MTKAIRIENADTSNHIVSVELWQEVEGQEDVLISATPLNYPTAMATVTIWKNRYVKIKEI